MAIIPSIATRPSNVISTASTATVIPTSNSAIEENYMLNHGTRELIKLAVPMDICTYRSLKVAKVVSYHIAGIVCGA